jgi:hypothetical protein
MGPKVHVLFSLRTVNSYALFSGYFEAVFSPQQTPCQPKPAFLGQMLRPVHQFTSFLFTHKAKDYELEGAIDAFYCETSQGVRVKHTTHSVGNYRITMIRTTYEHPTSKKLLRH